MLSHSICWSRIFLNGDDEIPNEKGLEFYDHIFDELVKYHIIPLLHYIQCLPPELQEQKMKERVKRYTSDVLVNCYVCERRFEIGEI